ncbi:inositol hexakisphosphate and diphosphoinositol-pentakisphosphate kinase isoform X4 [Sitodiplosis mosellana]|uniref:inositol hexakisphosphate and diphosphoinositol-pentakisphosphate kinase isoform X4 n=1 Tax=Sitodiplosis mosellana TaxID=263140 RepID=UPI002444243B|nr:inositol hexakisphosphate and diphosphoinositol-pentakisphosphate kinase isoform X4 [Sitodiplosis mosellana]XP_055304475.1 inositol hexakisphosphate and diphosphoinositol-pentakisphosphate kinase isoform X4 [Sitodiplosis mosellana]
MEWSWLRDWWRLKRLRHSQLRHSHEDIYYGHDSEEEDDDEDICYCDECVNGDIDLCGGDPNDGIDSDCSASSNSGKQVLVGICAMAKKAQSKPMTEILTRLREFDYIHMIVFEEEVILKDPVEKWPICDCLVSFHSKGFPLEKAIQYAQLRKPYVINNLHMQIDIQDRRKVYSMLESVGIEIPRYAVLDRDSPDPKQHELVESEDHVEVNGIIFNKPFVEKPVSAEDHNIYIYYPTSAGGGSQRLFRKIGSRSSVYSPESRVRKTGSFIYEDFMPTDGTDVKVYTVGPDYAHAEARKSPALDGKVERDSQGKEIRYPVILSNAEKLISRKVCMAFKQTVCGFDLLRANGKSFVCDVNGFSFVKNSNKYYDDCAKILGNMILRELTPTLHIPWSVPFQLDDPPIVPTTFGKMMELRCVVAVIRHGDRTPKQKMKVEVKHPKFFEIFEKYDGYKHGHIKLKRPKQLQEILDIARFLLTEIQTKSADSEVEEKQGKLEQLKSVLEMYGHFSGINRKVQMKYQPKGRPRGSSSDDGNGNSTCDTKGPSLVLILKWGGELTPAGRIQAEELGRIFRCMYPGGQGTSRHDQSGTQGLGLLRLHSTFRHDLKIYASDEGRVQMTAAAFAKGLLALEGELTPILVQMVKSANTNGLLDNDCESSKVQNMAKNRLHELMQADHDFSDEDKIAINPTNSISINQAINFVKNPFQCCTHVHELIKSLLTIIGLKKDDPKTRDAILYHGETWDLMLRRWGKIEKDFYSTKNKFDISKIPDIYDCIKYDLQHNQHTLQYEQAEELYLYAKYLADIVIPQEYGITIQEKLTIGTGICTPLLKKVKADLQRNIEEVGNESVNRLNPRYSHGVTSPGRHVRTRLYFTSESHIHSLLTVLRSGGLVDVMTDEQWRRAMEYISIVSELNYMSQIVIMLYEDPTKNVLSEERFHVELHFSPGVNCCVQKNLPPGPGFRPHSRNDSIASKNTSGEDDSAPARIEEESDSPIDEQKKTVNQKSVIFNIGDESTDMLENPPRIVSKHRHSRVSKPIPIGMHHTVCGSEAINLAKRLTEELASQQVAQVGSLGNAPTIVSAQNSPEELRSRSLEQGEKSKAGYSRYKSLQAVNKEDATQTTQCSTGRRQRHSIGQMGFFKIMDIAGGFGRKMASTNSLFSTAVISGSSSAPNLHQINTASPSALEGFFSGVPPIRPLETLHNALSLKQLDAFLEKMTTTTIFKTPASSPPKYPSTPLLTPTQTPHNSLTEKTPGPMTCCWSGQSSMTGSFSAMSSGGPSSPENSISRSELSASIVSSESVNLPSVDALSQMFPTLDGELGSVATHFRFDHLVATAEESTDMENDLKTPLQSIKQFPITTAPDEEDDDSTISTECSTIPTETKPITIQHTEGVISTATKMLEEIINKSSPKHRPEPLLDITKCTLPRSTNFQVPKQTSIHGSESTSSVGSSRPSSGMPQSDSVNRFPRRNYEYSRFMSVDQRSISDTEDNVDIESDYIKPNDNKTQSCANIKLSCTLPRSPGAIVVKEKYIELPKQRAHSIRTSSTSTNQEADSSMRSISLTSSMESVARLPKTTKPRFTTTKVDESQLGASVLKEV